MPEERQQWLPREGICSYEEILRVVRVGASLGVRKLRVTGGEPLVRRGVLDFMDALAAIPGIDDLGISTNGTLLCEPDAAGTSAVERLKRAGVGSVNISLDTLDRADYKETTGRDYLDKVLTGIDAALAAGIPKVKLNAVLMKGKSESALTTLIDFANEKGCLLRFIELMPVSSREMLTESNFLSVAAARKVIEAAYGPLVARPELKGNGPAAYFQIPGREQCIGFIGAMTNLHFCENCNKLRLTSDGKLRPCLGSHLEFDLLSVLRRGCTDEEIATIFRHVVDRKPKEHDFRENYQPDRKMVAIGG